MKKSILTIGLFSLMMVLTSFSASEIGGAQSAPRSVHDIGGAQSAPRSVYEIGGAQSAPRS